MYTATVYLPHLPEDWPIEIVDSSGLDRPGKTITVHNQVYAVARCSEVPALLQGCSHWIVWCVAPPKADQT